MVYLTMLSKDALARSNTLIVLF